MKDVYLIYAKINENLWDRKMKILVSSANSHEYKKDIDLDYFIGLYAWTTKKKYVDIFKDSRKSAFNKGMYSIKHIVMDKDEYTTFMNKYSFEKLKFYKFRTRPGFIYNTKPSNTEETVLCTQMEHEECVEDKQLIYEDMADLLRFDYQAFNDEYMYLFERIGYATQFDIEMYGGFPDDYFYEARGEAASYQESFGLSTNGVPIGVDLFGNQYGCLLTFYFEMFMGFERGQPIKRIESRYKAIKGLINLEN